MKKLDPEEMTRRIEDLMKSKDKIPKCDGCGREMVFQEWVVRQGKCSLCSLREEMEQ